MHKKHFKRSTLNSLTQKGKLPEHLLHVKDNEDSDDEANNHFLPSLQKKTTCKDIKDNASSWDENSTASSVSHASQIEDITTWKVMQEWEAIENTLYEDGEEVTQLAVLEECIQWRTQIPHLRVIGKNPFLTPESRLQEFRKNSKQIVNFDSFNETFSEYSFSSKEKKSTSKHKLKRTPQDKILDILFEHVMSELFSNNENDIDSLNDGFSDISQVHMTPAHSNKSSAKSTKFTWFEETIPLDSRFPNGRSKVIEDRIVPIEKGPVQTNIQDIQKKYENAVHNSRIRSGKHKVVTTEDKFLTHTSRNKLGTVFNEKIVVSPVPYVLSTRESFSTVKTTPIKFMGQCFEGSTFQGSSRNISCFKNLGRISTPLKISNYQSAWHSPTSSAVCQKNIKLAPLDTSRLVSNRNRSFVSSSVVLQRNRKPLSPISRSIMPASAHNPHNIHSEGLEIQGKHISSGQSAKLNVSSTAWGCNTGTKSKKKKGQLKKKT